MPQLIADMLAAALITGAVKHEEPFQPGESDLRRFTQRCLRPAYQLLSQLSDAELGILIGMIPGKETKDNNGDTRASTTVIYPDMTTMETLQIATDTTPARVRHFQDYVQLDLNLALDGRGLLLELTVRGLIARAWDKLMAEVKLKLTQPAQSRGYSG